MADITMCRGTGCGKAEDCYRFRATPNEYWQSYFLDAPQRNDEGLCSHYWPIIGYSQSRLQPIKEPK